MKCHGRWYIYQLICLDMRVIYMLFFTQKQIKKHKQGQIKRKEKRKRNKLIFVIFSQTCTISRLYLFQTTTMLILKMHVLGCGRIPTMTISTGIFIEASPRR